MTTGPSRNPTPLPDSVRSAVGPWADDLGVAAAAALAGGAATLRYYGVADLAIEEGSRGPVTAADRASHEVILETLATLRTGELVRSEEGGADAMVAVEGRLWIVDPLDGTREFIDGIDEFSVMVGLAQDGEALLGAVCQPGAGRLFLGMVEAGAWVMWSAPTGGRSEHAAVPLRVADAVPRRIRIVESRSHPDQRLRRLAARLAEHFPCEAVRSGSAGTKCARVAAGEADLYVHPVPHLREWDTCAGEAVARGAGGRVGDCLGEPLRYGKSDPSHPGGIFVAPPAVWERVAAEVAAVVGEVDDDESWESVHS